MEWNTDSQAELWIGSDFPFHTNFFIPLYFLGTLLFYYSSDLYNSYDFLQHEISSTSYFGSAGAQAC